MAIDACSRNAPRMFLSYLTDPVYGLGELCWARKLVSSGTWALARCATAKQFAVLPRSAARCSLSRLLPGQSTASRSG